MIGDLRKTLIDHVLQVLNIVQHGEDEDDEKEEDVDEDLETTGQVFGATFVLGQ